MGCSWEIGCRIDVNVNVNYHRVVTMQRDQLALVTACIEQLPKSQRGVDA
jgi:hypothetical protein